MAELTPHLGLGTGHSFEGVRTMAAGDAVNVDMRGCIKLTLLPGAGATATVSRVSNTQATAHSTSTVTIPADNIIPIDWPFLRLSVAGGTLQFATV